MNWDDMGGIEASAFLILMLQAISTATGAYFIFSKNLYRISVGIFLQTLSISSLILFLGYKMLALALFFWAFFGTVLFLAFSSSIVGNLNDSLDNAEKKPVAALSRALGLSVGFFLGGVFLWALRIQNLLTDAPLGAPQELSVESLGQQLLGEQVLAFHLMGLLILVVALGAAMLKRRIGGAP